LGFICDPLLQRSRRVLILTSSPLSIVWLAWLCDSVVTSTRSSFVSVCLNSADNFDPAVVSVTGILGSLAIGNICCIKRGTGRNGWRIVVVEMFRSGSRICGARRPCMYADDFRQPPERFRIHSIFFKQGFKKRTKVFGPSQPTVYDLYRFYRGDFSFILLD